MIDVNPLVKFLILEYTKIVRGLRVETQQIGFRRKFFNTINIRLQYSVLCNIKCVCMVRKSHRAEEDSEEMKMETIFSRVGWFQF